jgi:chromosome segregation ATPase
MDCIDTGWRNGWQLQASRLLSAHRTLAATPGTNTDPADLSVRPAVPPDQQEANELVLAAAAELQNPHPEIARIKGRLARERSLTSALRVDVARLSVATGTAERNAEALALELVDVRGRLEAELDASIQEKNYIAELLLEKSHALDDARNRVGFLEAALAAAENECQRLTTEAARAAENQDARCADLARREQEARAQASSTEERLTLALAAAERTIAAAKHTHANAASHIARLEHDLAAQRHRVAELEQSRKRLSSASDTLMDALQSRDRALARAKTKTAAPSAQRDNCANQASLITSVEDDRESRDLASVAAKSGTREQWGELLAQLTRLTKLRCQEPSPMSLLASTITF